MSDNTVRRGDRGLGKTASGGNKGSFASYEREAAAAPPPSVTGGTPPTEVKTLHDGARIERWRNDNGDLHNPDGPAARGFRPDGSVRYEEHRIDGKLHKAGGPALRYLRPDGAVFHEEHYINGELHNLDGPAVRSFYPDGSVQYEEFWVNGVQVNPLRSSESEVLQRDVLPLMSGEPDDFDQEGLAAELIVPVPGSSEPKYHLRDLSNKELRAVLSRHYYPSRSHARKVAAALAGAELEWDEDSRDTLVVQKLPDSGEVYVVAVGEDGATSSATINADEYAADKYSALGEADWDTGYDA